MDPDLNFSIAQVLEHGAVSDNVCGTARAVPTPGVLNIFVKKRHWWQIGGLQSNGRVIAPPQCLLWLGGVGAEAGGAAATDASAK